MAHAVTSSAASTSINHSGRSAGFLPSLYLLRVVYVNCLLLRKFGVVLVKDDKAAFALRVLKSILEDVE